MLIIYLYISYLVDISKLCDSQLYQLISRNRWLQADLESILLTSKMKPLRICFVNQTNSMICKLSFARDVKANREDTTKNRCRLFKSSTQATMNST